MGLAFIHAGAGQDEENAPGGAATCGALGGGAVRAWVPAGGTSHAMPLGRALGHAGGTRARYCGAACGHTADPAAALAAATEAPGGHFDYVLLPLAVGEGRCARERGGGGRRSDRVVCAPCGSRRSCACAARPRAEVVARARHAVSTSCRVWCRF